MSERAPHVHAIPEITHWSEDRPVSVGGVNVHACYFCHPSAYSPMPEGCTLCARCGVFMWTGKNDPHNGAMTVCKRCFRDLFQGQEAS